jgi:hypothetical protein
LQHGARVVGAWPSFFNHDEILKNSLDMLCCAHCDASYLKKAISVMAKILSIFMLTLTLLAGPASAQNTEQQEADELAALRYYAEVLSSLESVNYITNTARGDWRPSSLVEGEAELDGSGQLLRGVAKTLQELAEASDVSNQPWVRRWENYNNASGFVKKIGAAINLTAEFVEAVRNAETSTAEEKLRSMAQIVRDISTLLPESTAVDAYVGVLADGIESIAQDAAIIEAGTKRTNGTIALVNRMIVGEYDPEPVEDTDVSALEELEARIWELENRAAQRVFAEAYDKITEAETACAQDLDMSREDIFGLRRTFASASREIRNINMARRVNSELVPILNLRLGAASRRLIETRIEKLEAYSRPQPARAAFVANQHIERLEGEILSFQIEIQNAETTIAAKDAMFAIDLIDPQQEMEIAQQRLATVDDCVKEYLGAPDEELADLINTNFPQYERSIEEVESFDESQWHCPTTMGGETDLTCYCTSEATSRGNIWGTTVYTDDSPICRAAVHVGRIGLSGGSVRVIELGPLDAYQESTSNGVTSLEWDAWPRSIGFP